MAARWADVADDDSEDEDFEISTSRSSSGLKSKLSSLKSVEIQSKPKAAPATQQPKQKKQAEPPQQRQDQQRRKQPDQRQNASVQRQRQNAPVQRQRQNAPVQRQQQRRRQVAPQQNGGLGKRGPANAASKSGDVRGPTSTVLSINGLSKSYLDENSKRAVYTCKQLVGYRVDVQLSDGRWYQGIFHSANPNDFSVVLQKVTRRGQRERPKERMEIKQRDLVQIVAAIDTNTRNTAGTKQNLMTDTAISRNSHGGADRALTSFTDFEGAADQKSLAEEVRMGGSTSWDQFAANERLTGKKSGFDETAYTTTLDKSKVTREQVAKADATAKEILSRGSKNSVINRDRGRQVNGQDEEALFSGVRRVPDAGANGVKGRYVPPHRQGDAPAQSAQFTSEANKNTATTLAKPKAKSGGSWASVVNPGSASSSLPKKALAQTQQAARSTAASNGKGNINSNSRSGDGAAGRTNSSRRADSNGRSSNNTMKKNMNANRNTNATAATSQARNDTNANTNTATAGSSNNNSTTDRSKATAAFKESQKTIEMRLNKKFSEAPQPSSTSGKKNLSNDDSEKKGASSADSNAKKKTSSSKLNVNAKEFTMNVDAQEWSPSNFGPPVGQMHMPMPMPGMQRPMMPMGAQQVAMMHGGVPMMNAMIPGVHGNMPPRGSIIPVMQLRGPHMGQRLQPPMNMMPRGPMIMPGQMTQMQQQHMAHVLPPQGNKNNKGNKDKV